MRTFVMLLAIVLLLPAAHAILPGDPGFRGCVIADTQAGTQLADIECDGVPDVYDNCPYTVNPDQVDRDRNGLGDACDLIVDGLRVEPDQPMQGRSMVTTAYVMNNRPYPMRNLIVRLEAPKLGISTSEEIPLLQPGERVSQELYARIPECARTSMTDFVVIVEYPFAPGRNEVFSAPFRAPIVPSGSCANEQPDQKTFVDILEVQDVRSGEGATYPFKISNNEAVSKAYILSTSLIDWGSVQIEPGSVVVIAPGESKEGAIKVWAYPGTSAGRHEFLFTVQARNDLQSIQLTADVKDEAPPIPAAPSRLHLWLGILAFVGLLALIALAVLFMRTKHKRHIKKRTKK